MLFSMGELDELNITVLAEDTAAYDSDLYGLFGISILVDATKGEISKRILVDVGPEPKGLLENMRKLKVDPSTIDYIMLTHSHFDHTHGISTIVSQIGRNDVPVIAHPSLFRLHFVTRPYLWHVGIGNADMPSEIEKSGGKLFLVSEPLEIMEGLITSGEIERNTDYEEPGVDLYTVNDGKIVKDIVMDETALIANVAGKGLVIISGCSHAGIVNIAKHAQKVSGVKKIDGIMGGLHLIHAEQDRIKKTVQAIEKLEPSWFAAGHCTGHNAENALRNSFGERYSHFYSGSRYRISKK